MTRTAKRPVTRASNALFSALKKSGLIKKLSDYAAFPRWEELVGAELAKVSRPSSIIRGRILVVEVIDSCWVQEISLRKEQILDAINKLGEGKQFEDMRFTVSSPREFKNL